MTKVGLAIDGCLALDWYFELIKLVKIIPGLGFGPLVHAEVGYTFVPGNLKWARDLNDQFEDFHPDIKFDGFYFNVGVGIGLSTPKN